MKRSNEPFFWALFGAGGMLSALVAPVLVFATGIALPLGWLLAPAAWDYASMLALLQHPLARGVLLALVSLFMWHGCHRLLHSLHDLGFRTGRGAAWVFYGAAGAATVLAATVLLRIGF